MLIYACADYHMYQFNLHLFAIIKINLLHHKTFLVRILWLKSLSFLHYSNEAVLLKYLLLAGVNSQARRLGIVSSSPGKLLEDLYSTQLLYLYVVQRLQQTNRHSTTLIFTSPSIFTCTCIPPLFFSGGGGRIQNEIFNYRIFTPTPFVQCNTETVERIYS